MISAWLQFDSISGSVLTTQSCSTDVRTAISLLLCLPSNQPNDVSVLSVAQRQKKQTRLQTAVAAVLTYLAGKCK